MGNSTYIAPLVCYTLHCIENNINIRHLQNMLGHSSPKTTEIYTKTIEINNKTIISPLDWMLY
ncbi:hypothetical protein [Flavivirga jejuensis]|uniref:Phage integrase family protein n=1 Tax=Flavivirga jejuensis TaxID=870487 RepID=A0ABT8WQT0_9FLAO|nr:hypothetical protein [Flavivirga jejuensis]MDO5975494.1 hypothetical protein [Flavivirga jejuensis]